MATDFNWEGVDFSSESISFYKKINTIDIKLFNEIINTVRLIDSAMDVTDELDVYVNKLVSEKGSALEGWSSQFVKEQLLKLARIAISM